MGGHARMAAWALPREQPVVVATARPGAACGKVSRRHVYSKQGERRAGRCWSPAHLVGHHQQGRPQITAGKNGRRSSLASGSR